LYAAPLRERIGEHAGVGREVVVLISTVLDPFGIAVAALIDRVGHPPHPRDLFAGLLPGVPGLAAAVQQQHRRALFAINVGRERIARRTGEHRSRGRDVPRHECCPKNSSTPALKTLSPTAIM
jgi:hypothetical protein